ncbi:MAG: outer membrane protein assembly factor BamD [Holosporales bacterium]|jgi:outer membrane protein assembly factor BamD|nr:outer membrane protein assembly factor BamD [Holosporales bacterium]
MKRFSALLCIVLLVGCSRDLDMSGFEHMPPEKVLELGIKAMNEKNYSVAIQIFEEFERLYPYSRLTADAQINAGDCNYRAKKYDDAITSFEIFVKTHPQHKKVPYALYMLGLINFEMMPIVERDQESTIKAISYLSELCTRYEDSEYVKQATEMVKKLRQQMAGREVYVARFYQKRNNYAAAVVRLNVVINSYPETIHVPEAFHRLVECYVAMGFFDEAALVNQILQKNFSDTQWAKYASQLLSRQKPA